MEKLFIKTNVNQVPIPETFHETNAVVKHEKLQTPEDVLRLIDRSSDYTKIMFYRHPMDRLMSAWEDKVKGLSEFIEKEVK